MSEFKKKKKKIMKRINAKHDRLIIMRVCGVKRVEKG
jgi:PHD/YefM family antitoxin component YafN of YafNO toxin-antitoxin module